MSEHTPTPWEVSGDYIFSGDVAIPLASAHKEWATARGGYLFQTAQANAAFIVKAVNSYAEQHEALKGAAVVANTAGSLLKAKDEKIAELVSALKIAKDWMLCDIEYGDEEQFAIEFRLVCEALAKAATS